MWRSDGSYLSQEPLDQTDLQSLRDAVTDWLTVAEADAPNDSFGSWQYVGATGGYAQFFAPDEPGEYEIRLFWNDGYELGASTTITVE